MHDMSRCVDLSIWYELGREDLLLGGDCQTIRSVAVPQSEVKIDMIEKNPRGRESDSLTLLVL